MTDLEDNVSENEIRDRASRPSEVQVMALIEFVKEHPELARRDPKSLFMRDKIKKLWVQYMKIASSMKGSRKTSRGWAKFWADKRRQVLLKQKNINEKKIEATSLSQIDQQIYDLCTDFTLNQRTVQSKNKKKTKEVKEETYNGKDDEGDSFDEFLETEELEVDPAESRLLSSEGEERQLDLMEKLVDVMGSQAAALSQVALASQDNARALGRLAEASHMQALAVDRVASSFESISSSVRAVGGVLASIDYTMKRGYHAPAQAAQNTNLFS